MHMTTRLGQRALSDAQAIGAQAEAYVADMCDARASAGLLISRILPLTARELAYVTA